MTPPKYHLKEDLTIPLLLLISLPLTFSFLTGCDDSADDLETGENSFIEKATSGIECVSPDSRIRTEIRK